MGTRRRKAPLRQLYEGDPHRPRSRQILLRPDVTPSGRRRKDERDWLSNMEAGHPELKPPLDAERR